MKRWLPEPIYQIKPWVLVTIGGVLALGMMGWSWYEGSWEPWRSALCFIGATGAIGGGAILQLRQEYRARSKWTREHTKSAQVPGASSSAANRGANRSGPTDSDS